MYFFRVFYFIEGLRFEELRDMLLSRGIILERVHVGLERWMFRVGSARVFFGTELFWDYEMIDTYRLVVGVRVRFDFG